MVNLMRRDPLLESMPAVGVMNRLMDRFFSDPLFAEPGGGVLEEIGGMLPLDIQEDEQNLIVRASLPGFSKDEVNVELNKGVLAITAEHREEKEERTARFIRRERRMGSLARQVVLPGNLKEEQCRAELESGVLTLIIPKNREGGIRKIEVRDGGNGERGQKGTTRPENRGSSQQRPQRGNAGTQGGEPPVD
jgi:HSP20 family protein